jgi:hypothetical protein
VAKTKVDAEKDALRKQREQACFSKFPDANSSDYQDCVLIVTGTDSDRARIMLSRGEACMDWNVQGSPQFNRCVMPQNIFAVDFVPQTWMQYLPTIEQWKQSQERADTLLGILGITIGGILLTAACGPCGEIIGGLALSLMPEGAALMPFLTTAAAISAEAAAGAVAFRTAMAELETATVEAEALDAALAEQTAKLAQLAEEERVYQLGVDPAIGGYRASESETAVRVEQELGVQLQRAPQGASYDWVGTDGFTYDAVGNFPGRFFDQQWENLKSQIVRHINDKAERVPVDVSQFTPEQIQRVRDFIAPLGPNVFIVGA